MDNGTPSDQIRISFIGNAPAICWTAVQWVYGRLW